VLDFSRIEAKRLDLEHTAFDLREAVGDAAKVLALRAAEKGLELACHIHPDVPDEVLGDVGRLRQVLLNVLGNAVKFTDAGEVVLDVNVEEVNPLKATLRFAVMDTGIGIPADKQQQIFQAFTQADASTTRRFGGTGLGLAIALRLVELMHGRMWVESHVGRGSTFFFTASFDRPQVAAHEPLVDKTTALDGLRVLVVDDNATNRRILDEMLASWQMKPTPVADAQAALDTLAAVARQEPFDVILADRHMPGVDGFMLARRVRRDKQFGRTPIIMMMSVGDAKENDGRGIGVDAYLTKPVKHSDLLDALATLFRVSTRRPRPERAVEPSARPRRRLRVLLAEDNLVNRKLVVRLLEKRGHHVHAVENGRIAVTAIASAATGFDVVLMDLQMPEMSGFEATHEIRERERGGDVHLPIVALTAHAMAGDRERCLAAGMDGYLSKPIEVNDLITTVERFGGNGAAPVGARREPSAPRVATFDEKTALAYTGGDRQLLKEVIDLFRKDSPAALRRIERALHKRDGDALRLAAHALKGAIATVGSSAGRETAAELEMMAKSSRFTDGERVYAHLRELVRELDAAFVAAGLVTRTAARTTRIRRRATRTKRSRK
jgi:CheY-like chemotaxis protein